MALINSGFMVENPADLTEPLEKLIKVGFSIARDAPVEEIEIILEEEVDDDEEPAEDDEEGEVIVADLGDLDDEVDSAVIRDDL